MNYALNLAEDGRILSATYPQYAPADAAIVDYIPEGNLPDYLYINGEYVYDPIPKVEVKPEPTAQDDTDAIMVDHEYRLTLLELGIT